MYLSLENVQMLIDFTHNNSSIILHTVCICFFLLFFLNRCVHCANGRTVPSQRCLNCSSRRKSRGLSLSSQSQHPEALHCWDGEQRLWGLCLWWVGLCKSSSSFEAGAEDGTCAHIREAGDFCIQWNSVFIQWIPALSNSSQAIADSQRQTLRLGLISVLVISCSNIIWLLYTWSLYVNTLYKNP